MLRNDKVFGECRYSEILGFYEVRMLRNVRFFPKKEMLRNVEIFL